MGSGFGTTVLEHRFSFTKHNFYLSVHSTPQKRYKHVLMDDVAVTFLSALQSTASLLSVLLSLSPVEVGGIAKEDCQTVDVLSTLSGFTAR